MAHPFTFNIRGVEITFDSGKLFAHGQQITAGTLLKFRLGLVDLPPPQENIVDIAAGAEDFSLLVRALQTTGLDAAVRDASDITVFAPTNDAFRQLATDLGFSDANGSLQSDDDVFNFLVAALGTLGDPVELLSNVLLYHVAPGAQTAEDIADQDQVIGTLLDGATITSDGATLVDLDPNAANPELALSTITGSNGTILPINLVLRPLDVPPEAEPPANIVTIAAGSDDFNILVRALDTAGLVGTIQAATDITVFAPTDAAFGQLAADLGFGGDVTDEDAVFGFLVEALTELGAGNPIPVLENILLYHVSPGAKSSIEINAEREIETLLSGGTFETDNGELVDNEPDIDNPTIVIKDIEAENGTIQVIDRVLIPLDLPGNEQDQFLFGTRGNDMLEGGNGDDLALGRKGNDSIEGSGGDDNLFGGLGHDDVRGGEGDDRVFGNIGGDLVAGGAGNDVVSGGQGFDRLFGNSGDDRLFGGSSSDLLNGGSGDDHLIGGGGRDVFDFRVIVGDDTVRDFTRFDTLRFSTETFADAHAVLAATRFEKGRAIIEADDGSITLLGVRERDLNGNDFDFV